MQVTSKDRIAQPVRGDHSVKPKSRINLKTCDNSNLSYFI